MNILNSSPAAEEKMKAATNRSSAIISANQPITKLLCLVSISLLLGGCAAIPLPLKIASNLHTAVTVIKNTDDNPENDSQIVTYLTENFAQESEAGMTTSDAALIKNL